MTTIATNAKYGENEVGCWVDCHRGIYIGEEVIQTARDHGWKPGTPMPEDGWTEHEHYCELWDEAEEFMQQFAAEGYYFGTSEGFGDWGLWRIEETT
jgi:hypothetical protein